jgi:outer membrane protein assembly factor BamB
VSTTPVFDPLSGLVFTGTANGFFYAIDPQTQAIKWSIIFEHAQTGDTLTYPAVVVGAIVYFAISIDNPATQHSTVYAVDISTGHTLWTADYTTGVSCPLSVGDGLVFVGLFDNTMRALDQGNGSQLWSFPMNKYVFGQPAYSNNWVYFGSEDGNFYAHASRPQNLQPSEWAVPVTDRLLTGVLLDGNNKAYFGGMDTAGNGYFYVLDVTKAAKGNPEALTDALSGQLLFTPSIGFNQIAFCAQGLFGGELIEINLGILDSASADDVTLPLKASPRPPKQAPPLGPAGGGMLSMADFTSQLIVDQYDLSGTSAAPTTPAFQMMLSLYDINQAPQTSSNVSVWATDPVTVTAGGQSYSLGTSLSQATVLPASTAGQLTLSSAGSIGMTSLCLQPDFFVPGFYITVYPDTGNFRTMSNLTASDLDPTTAVDYTNQAILQANFQGLPARTAIASAISNTVGGQPQSTTNKPIALIGKLGDDAPSQSYQPGAVPSFTVDFSSGITFTPNSSEDIAKWFGGPKGPGKFWSGDGFLDFDDFITNIVNGIEGVGSIVWHFAEGVAGVIVNGLKNAYQFVVETIEQAMQVATAIWKQVASDINSVVQWLSYLFNWTDIVNTHTLIKTQILTTISNYQTWIDNELKEATNDVDAFFTARENDALTIFDAIIAQLGSTQTIQGVRKLGGDPNAAFSSQGQDVTTQANWLPRKVSENVTAAALANPALFSITGDSTALTAIENFFTSVGKQISSDQALQSLPADAAKAVKDFSKFFTGEKGFAGQTLADVLAVVRDLVAGLIYLGKVVADAFLTLLQTVIDGIVDFLTGTIQIPFVSDFYTAITNDQLSVISLFSLIAAVPTTIVYKLITGSAPSDSPAAGVSATSWVGLANTFSLLLLLPLWVASDLANFPPLLSGVICAATAVQAGLGFTLITMGGPNAADYIMWSAQFLSVLLSAYGIWLGEAWAEIGPMIYGPYGFGMMLFYIIYASTDPAKYWDPDSEPFFANVSSALPYLAQPLTYIKADDVGPAAVALLDMVGYGTSAALSTILYWSPPQAAKAGT